MHYLYGLVSSGHVSGGINIFPPFIVYDPMEVINYEAGWKARLVDDQFHTQLSIYYETFDDYQANFSEFTVPGINNPTNRNAETESTVWGVEFSGQARFGNFALDFGLAYMDSELGTFSDVRDPFRSTGDANGDGIPDDVVNLSGAHVRSRPSSRGTSASPTTSSSASTHSLPEWISHTRTKPRQRSGRTRRSRSRSAISSMRS